jgi:antitoxin (DNA-binding transcriptional repressor) of toxin-antitoxin stability system
MIEVMALVHMTEAEIAGNFHAVLERVREGAEILIEEDHRPVAVLRAAEPPHRTISECIALAEQRERERGYAITLDPDFAEAVEEVVRKRHPWNPPSWD